MEVSMSGAENRTGRKGRLAFISAMCAVISGVALIGSLVPSPFRPSPEDVTMTSLGETAFRIRMAIESGTIPHSFDDLPVRPGYTNAKVDGWQHPITFEVVPVEPGMRWHVSIRSSGKDGSAGASDDLGYDNELVLKDGRVESESFEEQFPPK